MTVRLRLAIVSLFLAGFLSGALGPHCAAMFASPAAARPNAAASAREPGSAASIRGGAAASASTAPGIAIAAQGASSSFAGGA